MMKGKCKKAYLSLKLLTKSRLLIAGTEALVRKILMMESLEKISGKGKW